MIVTVIMTVIMTLIMTMAVVRMIDRRVLDAGEIPHARLGVEFLKELVANHTQDDYFTQIAPYGSKAPLDILREKNEDWYFGIIEAFCGKDARKFLNG